MSILSQYGDTIELEFKDFFLLNMIKSSID